MPTPNDAMIKAMESYFPRLASPSTALGNCASLFMHLPGVRAYWPMSASTLTGGASIVDIINGLNPVMTNTPTHEVDGLAPMVRFSSAGLQYATYPDNANFDILGTEANMVAALRGMTIGGWWRVGSLSANQSLFGKYYTTGNLRAYRAYTSLAGFGDLNFSVSTDGINDVTVTLTGANAGGMAIGQWRFVVCRYDPSTELKLWNNSTTVEYSNTLAAGVPASIFNSTEPFELGRSNRTNYLNGYLSNWFVCAAAVPDVIIWNLWQNTRSLYI